jgi:hypothetical protein
MSGRRSEGPLLALLVLGLIVGVLVLIVAIASGSPSVRGIGIAVLGLGAIATRREIADVLAGFSRPTPPKGYLQGAGVAIGILGLIGVGYGVSLLV